MNKEKCCGGCSNFLYEDIVGRGICAFFKTYCDMGTVCEHYTEEPRQHCSQCKNWNMGFDNSCAVRIAKYNDFSNQPADQTDCEYYEPEEVSHG